MGDLLFTARPTQSARSTVIVGIDEKSYRALLARHGPLSAWPRTLYADALDALRPAAPRVVAFAIFFDAQRPEDGALAEAMRRAGNVIVPVVAQGAKAFDPRPGVAQEFEAFVRPAATVRSAAVDEGLANITTAPGQRGATASPAAARPRRRIAEPGAHDRDALHPPAGRPGRARGTRRSSTRRAGRSRSGSTTRC